MINKKVSAKGTSVRVTFELPAEFATDAVAVVGDFNEWNAEEGTMKFVKSRKVWTKAISLKPGNTYQFRYFVDGAEWCNDEAADAYVANEFFSDNSVVTV